MSFSSKTTDVNDIAKKLMNATADFVSRRIQHKKDRDAYLKAFRYAYLTLKETNVSTANQLLKAKKKSLPSAFMKRYEFFTDVKRYYMMAIDQAIDILDSIDARFNTGSSDPDDIFLCTILEGKDEDKGIF